MYSHIIGSRLKGWAREGEVTVSWLGPDYLIARVPVRCGDGTKFVAEAFVWTGRDGAYGNVMFSLRLW